MIEGLKVTLADSNVEFCRKWAVEHGDADGEYLAAILLRMSRTQRMKLYRLAHV